MCGRAIASISIDPADISQRKKRQQVVAHTRRRAMKSESRCRAPRVFGMVRKRPAGKGRNKRPNSLMQNPACCQLRKCSREGNILLRLLEYLVEMFIQGFGITRPTDAQRKKVTVLLGGVLLTGALLVILASVAMILYLHQGR
jgi:hypothetical protein